MYRLMVGERLFNTYEKEDKQLAIDNALTLSKMFLNKKCYFATKGGKQMASLPAYMNGEEVH